VVLFFGGYSIREKEFQEIEDQEALNKGAVRPSKSPESEEALKASQTCLELPQLSRSRQTSTITTFADLVLMV